MPLAEQVAHNYSAGPAPASTTPGVRWTSARTPAGSSRRRWVLAHFGRVLELADGAGHWTVELARHASAVTAVASSGEGLVVCPRRVDAPHLSLVEADLFAGHPDERATTS